MEKVEIPTGNWALPFELQKRKAEYLLYLLTSKALFEKFINKRNPFNISFIDKDGLVLMSMGNGKVPFVQEGFVVDDSIGITAINYCLNKVKSIEIKGKEHKNQALNPWSCAASPVKDREGKIVGVISISALSNNYPDFALGVSTLIASAVENEVNLKTLLQEVDISKKFSEIIADGNKDGVLVLDKDARVLYINTVGARILSVDRQTAMGKNVSEIVDFTPVILEVFKTHKGYIDREFIIESPSRGLLHFIKTAVILKDSDGNFAGAVDFFREIERVRKFVTSYMGAEARFTFSDIKGNNPKLKEAIRLSKIAARSKSPVLLEGETGTGKEMFAQAIHFESERNSGPFVALNCGAVPRDIAESELFGYEPGAFTDADKRGRPGKFELANGGTLLLDEIEELPLSLQTKLLRILEDKVLTRVGGTKSLKIDVRVIAISNKKLEELVEKGMFREDLFYRLNVLKINIPSLRERKDDILLLVKYFVEKFSKELGKGIEGCDDNFIKPLLSYDFPGNVRELQNIIERAVNITESRTLTEELLPDSVFERIRTEEEDLDYFKKELIEKVLLDVNFNITLASKKLGMSRPTLYKLIKRFGISNNHNYL